MKTSLRLVTTIIIEIRPKSSGINSLAKNKVTINRIPNLPLWLIPFHIIAFRVFLFNPTEIPIDRSLLRIVIVLHPPTPDPNKPSYQKSPHYSSSPSHNQNQGIHYEPQQPQWHRTQWI